MSRSGGTSRRGVLRRWLAVCIELFDVSVAAEGENGTLSASSSSSKRLTEDSSSSSSRWEYGSSSVSKAS